MSSLKEKTLVGNERHPLPFHVCMCSMCSRAEIRRLRASLEHMASQRSRL